MKARRKRASGPGRGGQGGDVTPGERLLRWAKARFDRERRALEPTLCRLTSEGIESWPMKALIELGGPNLLPQAAAVLARTSGELDLVGYLARTQPMTMGLPIPASTAARMWAGYCIARTRAGRLIVRVWQQGPKVAATSRGGLDLGSHDADFTKEGFHVDPRVEHLLSTLGVPGAVAQAVEDEPAPEEAKPHILRLTTEAYELPSAWESVRQHVNGYRPAFVVGLVPHPIAPLAGGPPAGIKTRSITDLLANGWRTENEALFVVHRLQEPTVILPVVEAFEASGVSPRVKRHAWAYGAWCANAREGRPEAKTIWDVFAERMEAVSEGDLGAWLASQWPARPTLEDSAFATDIADVCFYAAWKVMEAGGLRDGRTEAVRAQDVRVQAERAEALCTAILGATKVQGGALGERIVELQRRGFGRSVPPDGLSDLEDMRKTLFERHQKQRARPMEELLAEYAAYHVTHLHAIRTFCAAMADWRAALEQGDMTSAPLEAVSKVGLVGLARSSIARWLVIKAERLGPVLGPPLLDRAAELAPWDDLMLVAANEGRFRAGVRSARLLKDLVVEADLAPSLAATATRVAVGEHAADRRAYRRLLKQLLLAGRGTTHEWMARAIATRGRPEEWARPAALRSLLGSVPELTLDPCERLVHALYGDDPARAVGDMRRAMEAQVAAVEEAARIEEERVLDILTRPAKPRAGRPSAPEPGPGATEGALRALRYRLDRPGFAHAAEKPAVEAHYRRALRLAARASPDSVLAWVTSLGRAGSGLVFSLDAALELADFSGLLAPLKDAERALDLDLASTWVADATDSLDATLALAARQGPSLRASIQQRVDVLFREVAVAQSDAQRESCDTAVAQLLADATAWRDPDAPAGGKAGTEAEDGFRDMRIGRRAVARSRAELGTPEWAITLAIRLVARFNLARGRRDLKSLGGTRDERGVLVELRHMTKVNPLRVLYRHQGTGPVVLGMHLKDDEDDQRRVIERVMEWVDEPE